MSIANDRTPRETTSAAVRSAWKKNALFWSTIVATLTGVVGAVTGVIPIFHHEAVSKPGPAGITVTSTNQSGGITAGIVNLGPPQRHLDATTRTSILQHAPAGANVYVCAIADPEAQQFANEIVQFLIKEHYRINDSVCTTFPAAGSPRVGLNYRWEDSSGASVIYSSSSDILDLEVLKNPQQTPGA